MERRKLTKEDLDKVRHIEGFPIGKDEDIIALSDAPYYTACPNPFIEDFIRENGTPYDEATDDYHREPFTADVSEGKNDPIYMAHSYHTKVPHKAIMHFIEHYTDPGDVVFDGFCGTGMTGVAARALGEKSIYVGDEGDNSRYAIISDLSPIASFLSSQYNTIIDPIQFYKEATEIIEECEKEFDWMFLTRHDSSSERQVCISSELPSDKYGRINYTVLSDVFICPVCGEEIVFWNAAVDHAQGKVNDSFMCSNCGASLKKQDCSRAKIKSFDEALGETIEQAKLVPVQINYTYAGKRYTKEPDKYDLELLEKIDNYRIPYPYPCDHLPIGFNTDQPIQSHGLTNVHHFYSKRNLAVLAAFAYKARGKSCFVLVHSVALVNTKLYRYRWAGGFAGAGGGPLSGTLYIPSLIKDINICKSLSEYANKTQRAKSLLMRFPEHSIVSTQSATDLQNIPDNCCDYIFTDPPFGANLNYSELSFLWESWLKVKTNNAPEAIINNYQGKSLIDYQNLMVDCFKEFFRILKPNRWMTVEFHNSKNAVWNAIQEALQRAGFVLADVRTLDKKQASFKQVTTVSAVKQDLIISAYKPKESFRKEIIDKSGQPETAWAFVQQHLENIPVVVNNKGKIELIAERQAFLLFDRMVAYHIMQGIPVPLDATDFYRGLDEHFLKRDGMYFLPEQVNEYDQARIENDLEDVQLSFIVSNEKSAISWLYAQLETPQTYAELQPKFMQEVRSIDKFEAMPELSVLLEENFLQSDDGKWYIPDITKEADMAKLREKSLLKEFDGYLATKGKLKLFRSEAIRAGFARLWKDKNYKLIVETAERLPEQVIQEDDKLLMYYDISLGRV